MARIGASYRNAGRGRNAGPADQLLREAVLERGTVEAARVLYFHWLTLRNPAAGLLAERPRLPGQEVPGLGLAREVAEGRVRMKGATYAWKADEMARWLRKHPADEAATTRARERGRFTLEPEAPEASPASH
jgi:hypothetical protein